MRRWIMIIGLCGLALSAPASMVLPPASMVLPLASMLLPPASVLAQGGDPTAEGIPCTAADLAPLGEIVSGMVAAVSRDGALEVEALLGWRAEIAALDVPRCAGMLDAVLQLQLASDELLIGALLLERAALPAHADARDTLANTAAVALNTGLTNLVGMRFTLAEAAGDSSAAALPFGALDGAAVIAAFEAAGLPLADVNLAAGPAGGAAPATERERVTFSLPTVFDGGRGQVLIFAEARGRDTWLAYLFGELVDPGYVYIHQNVILQLTPELDRATALRFQAALRAVN